MRVIVVEPWAAGSHEAWAAGLAGASTHELHVVRHDGRFWRWRMRGGSLTLADEVRELIGTVGPPDALVVSGTVDVSSLLGFLRRDLHPTVPVAVYLHESQLLFPVGPSQQPEEEFAMVNWRSMAVADAVWCNSAFHRDALVAALPPFLAGVPDRPHTAHLAGVVDRTTVLPVGVDTVPLIEAARTSTADAGGPPLVLWNHRWDHDKNPQQFLGIVVKLAEQGVPFRLAVVGENRRTHPREFDAARAVLADRIDTWGWVDRDGYRALLLRSDVVVSTAIHEFFGIAMVEAMAAGCVPLLPRRLSYPELVPEAFHPAALYRGRLFDRLRAVLTDLPAARAAVAGLRPAMAAYDWSAVAPRYDAALESLGA